MVGRLIKELANSEGQKTSEKRCTFKQILVAARSKAWVCDRLTSEITFSSPSEGMDTRLLCLLCCEGRGLCGGLITRSEESYRKCV